jgi:hypothetical protein
MNPEEYYEYTGDFTFRVDDGERGPVLRFLRDEKVVTEIHLSRTGAQTLGVALLRRT